MNKLSLFLYLADLVQNLQVLAVIGIVVCVCWLALGFDKECYNANGVQEYPFYALTLGYHRRYVVLLIALSVFTAIIPSERTLYMIAASESAEVIVNSQEAKDDFALLKTVLQKYIEPTK